MNKYSFGQWLIDTYGDDAIEKYWSKKNTLDSLNIKYIIQLSKTTFSWCGKYKYDFYLPIHNVIIECHGGQHYKQSTRGKNLKDEQQNDINKMKLAKQYVNEYLVVNMSESNLNWFKKNCVESLSSVLNLSNVNWELIWEKSQNSLVIKSWNLWNKGLHNTKEIGKKLGITKRTVLKYMKLGAEYGKCDYTKEESYNASRR